MLIFVYIMFFSNFLILHFAMEFFIFLVYGMAVYVLFSFVYDYLSDITFFEIESTEDEAISRFFFLGVMHYHLLNIRLFRRTIYLLRFVDVLVSAICKDFKSKAFSYKLDLLHRIYMLEDINGYIDELYDIQSDAPWFLRD